MEKYFMAAITSVDQIGPKRMRQLLDHFGSAQATWSAPEGELLEVGLSDRIVQSLLSMRRRYPNMADEIMTRCEAKGIRVCGIDDADYPIELRSIDSAPPVLYYKGEIQPSAMMIAMVGTRQISRYGEQVTLEIAEDLARMGIIVVSGGAAGIDTFAHRGALKGGRTVAVMGCGLEVVYPNDNRRLFDRIVENGALISEYPPKMPPTPGQFPRRNRIIAGLSKGVVVVEAGEKSGALNTAEHALHYGRNLFAVPGSIYAERSLGCNNLIKYNGAVLVRNAQDILGVYNMEPRSERITLEPLLEEEAQIFELVPTEKAATLDEIMFRAESGGLDDLTVPYLVNVLNALQLKGYVMEDAVGSYLRTAAAPDKTPPVDKQSRAIKNNRKKKHDVELNDEEAIVFSFIDRQPIGFDDILLKTDEKSERAVNVQELNAILFALELKGLVIQDDLGNYSRTKER